MANTDDKAAGKAAPHKPDEKPGHETTVAFDDIIEAILDTNLAAVEAHKKKRAARKRSKVHRG